MRCNKYFNYIKPLLLLGSSGSLGLVDLLNLLDDTDGDGLTHITDGEATEGSVLSESLNTEGLGGDHLDDGRVTRLDKLGVLLSDDVGTTIDLGLDLNKLAGSVRSVAIDDGGVAGRDLARVVQDDDLSNKGRGLLGGVVLGISGDVATANVLGGDVLDVEADVVSGHTLGDGLVMHFHRLDFSGETSGGKDDGHTGLDDTGLDTADGDGTNTTDFVDVLQGKAQRLVRGTGRGLNGVNGIDQSAGNLGARGADDLSSLEPRHVGGGLQHVVSVPARQRDHSNGFGLVTNTLQVLLHFLADFVVALLAPLADVHLVDGNDHLLDTEGEGKKGVLAGLAFLGDTSLKLTGSGGDGEDGTVGLGGTSNHVLDKVAMSGGVDDGDGELVGLELGQSSVDGDTTFTLSLQFVQNPGVLERALAHFVGFLLELFNGALVNTTALVNQVSGSGGLARVDVSDDDDGNVNLVLGHLVKIRMDGLLRRRNYSEMVLTTPRSILYMFKKN